MLPSLADEWGLVVVEALSQGTPVVGSIYSEAVASLVAPGVNGFSFAPDDPTQFASALDDAAQLSVDDWHSASAAAAQLGGVDNGGDHRGTVPRRHRGAMRSSSVSGSTDAPPGAATGRRYQIRRTAVATVGARVAAIGASLVVVRLILHTVGPERFGLWTAINASIALLSFADLGIGNSLLTALSRSRARNDTTGVARLISSATYAFVAIAVALTVVLIVLFIAVNWANVFRVNGTAAARDAELHVSGRRPITGSRIATDDHRETPAGLSTGLPHATLDDRRPGRGAGGTGSCSAGARVVAGSRSLRAVRSGRRTTRQRLGVVRSRARCADTETLTRQRRDNTRTPRNRTALLVPSAVLDSRVRLGQSHH